MLPKAVSPVFLFLAALIASGCVDVSGGSQLFSQIQSPTPSATPVSTPTPNPTRSPSPVPSVINGSCGLAILSASLTAPTSNLCSSGQASVVTTGRDIAGVEGPTGAVQSDFNGLWSWSCAGIKGGSTTYCSSDVTRAGSSPSDSSGNVIATSYTSLPFSQQIFGVAWGTNNGLDPAQLFFDVNPKSPFSIFQSAAGAHEEYTSRTSIIPNIESQGIVPFTGAQRWNDTWLATFPTDFSCASDTSGTCSATMPFVDSDRNGASPYAATLLSNTPEFTSWRDWYSSRPQLWDVSYNGGTSPIDWQSWGGQWGYINPLTPLDAPDCPPDMSSCTYGDFLAYHWGKVAALNGVYAISLSDYTAGLPGNSNQIGFNPRIVHDFAAQKGLSIPGVTASDQISWIVTNAFNQWNDYLSQGFGQFYASIASRLGSASGRDAIVITQCTYAGVLGLRSIGEDPRSMVSSLNPKNYLCYWDEQVITRTGPIASPPMLEVGSFSLAAAYEPLVRNGPELEADDQAFWNAILSFYPTLTGGTSVSKTYGSTVLTLTGAQAEVGYKLLKRLWLSSSWSHIADRAGNVRRAMAFMMRDYWDAGSIQSLNTSTTNFTSLITGVVPTRPFGPAIYYSESILRASEAYLGSGEGVQGNFLGSIVTPNSYQQFVDAGGVANYFVTDAALSEIQTSKQNAPSAWVVLQDVNGRNALGDVPTSELQALQAIAPVIHVQINGTGANGAAAAVSQLNALSNQPLLFTQGLTGFGFYDQNGRLILVVSNPSTLPTAASITGSIVLKGVTFSGSLANGTLPMTDLMANTSSSVTFSNGAATLPVTVGRWDTLVYALQL